MKRTFDTTQFFSGVSVYLNGSLLPQKVERSQSAKEALLGILPADAGGEYQLVAHIPKVLPQADSRYRLTYDPLTKRLYSCIFLNLAHLSEGLLVEHVWRLADQALVVRYFPALTPEEDAPFEITVKHLFTSQDFTLKVQPSFKVEHLKALITQKEGVPIGHQRILYKDKRLDNDETLRAYGISAGDTVFAMYDLRGGTIHVPAKCVEFCTTRQQDLEPMSADTVCLRVVSVVFPGASRPLELYCHPDIDMTRLDLVVAMERTADYFQHLSENELAVIEPIVRQLSLPTIERFEKAKASVVAVSKD